MFVSLNYNRLFNTCTLNFNPSMTFYFSCCLLGSKTFYYKTYYYSFCPLFVIAVLTDDVLTIYLASLLLFDSTRLELADLIELRLHNP